MGRKNIEIKTLHGFTIEQLQKIIKKTNNHYTRNVLSAVIMRYEGVSTTEIMNVLGKSRATVTCYINSWNENPSTAIKDHRGGNRPNRLTDEIVNDIKHVITSKTPKDFGYSQNKWSSSLLTQYIKDTYGKEFSDRWIRKLLNNLGFSYKGGEYKPTKADPHPYQQFSKND